MPYDIQLLPAVTKWLEALRDAKLRQRIEKRLLTLKDNPRPSGCEALAGQANRWRVRVGDHRIIYTIEDEANYNDASEICARLSVRRLNAVQKEYFRELTALVEDYEDRHGLLEKTESALRKMAAKA